MTKTQPNVFIDGKRYLIHLQQRALDRRRRQKTYRVSIEIRLKKYIFFIYLKKQEPNVEKDGYHLNPKMEKRKLAERSRMDIIFCINEWGNNWSKLTYYPSERTDNTIKMIGIEL